MTNHNVDPCCVQLGPELFDHPAWTCFEPCLGAFDQKQHELDCSASLPLICDSKWLKLT